MDELRARGQVGDAPDPGLAHPEKRALPEIEPVAGDDEGGQGRALDVLARSDDREHQAPRRPTGACQGR